MGKFFKSAGFVNDNKYLLGGGTAGALSGALLSKLLKTKNLGKAALIAGGGIGAAIGGAVQSKEKRDKIKLINQFEKDFNAYQNPQFLFSVGKK